MNRYRNLSRKGKIAVWAVVAVVVIAIATGGGSGEQETAAVKPTATVEQTTTTEKVTTTEATTTTMSESSISEMAWLSVLSDRGIDIPITDGYAVCMTLEEVGPSVGALIGIGEALVEHHGFSYGDAGAVIGASVAAFCPQYSDTLDTLARQSGYVS